MADEEQTPEQRAAELRAELSVLEEFAQERQALARAEREKDEARGQARGEELFAEGSLGRVDSQPTDEALGLIDERRALIDQFGADASILTEAERLQSRTEDRYSTLLNDLQDPNSKANIASRDQANKQVDRQLRSNLRAIGGIAAQRGVRTQLGLVNDALQGAVDARANLERDLLIARDQQRLSATNAAAQAETAAVANRADIISQRTQRQNELQSRLEDLQGAIDRDILNRQILNLQQRSSEVFGRLSTEQNVVSLGVAERGGAREQILGEIGAIEQRQNAEESLEIQRIEAEKPPPSSGGGKSIVCIAHWIRGNLQDHILAADFAFCESADHIDEDVRRGYHWYGEAMADAVMNPDYLICAWMPNFIQNILRDITMNTSRGPVVAWANTMAHHYNGTGNVSLIGRSMEIVGVTVTRWIGKALKWAGHNYIIPPSAEKYWHVVEQAGLTQYSETEVGT